MREFTVLLGGFRRVPGAAQRPANGADSERQREEAIDQEPHEEPVPHSRASLQELVVGVAGCCEDPGEVE